MDVEPHVQFLLEEMLDSGHTPEEACRDCPELLPLVLKELRQKLACDAHLDALFAASEPGDLSPEPPSAEMPQIPGHELDEVLGRGGMGVVYRARHVRLNRTVAIKMLLNGAHGSPEARERFMREAEAVAGLRHPNIVQVYELGDQGGQPYFTMEFIEGGNLARKLAGTPQPPRHAATLLATLAEAVEAAHRSGIVHRDLKPSNVLLTADGTPKVSDFGLARRMEGESGLTWTGTAVGTPSYMAPEQAEAGAVPWGPAVDVYALGAILYELLTGRPPFRAETAAATIRQVISQDPAPPSRLNAKVPRDVETICLKCLNKDPHLRYTSAAALAADLHSFLVGEAITARPDGPMARLARRVRRRPALSAAAATVAFSAIVLLAGALWLISDRAEAARKTEIEKVTLERAAGQDLRDMARSLETSSWPDARAALERARGRLGGRGSAGQRRLLDQGDRDLKLVGQLDAIRLDRAITDGGIVRFERSADTYEAAFREAGLGRAGDAPESVASRVASSNIRGALLAALDDWAVSLPDDPAARALPLAVARLADRDSTAWRTRARDLATWNDRKALAEVVAAAPVVDEPPPFLLGLAHLLEESGGDAAPFLRRIQQAHPGDFWANVLLGRSMTDSKNPVEAVRYYQAALAIRPGLALVHNNLARALASAGRPEEAVAEYHHALRIDPTAARFRHNLAFALRSLGRLDEALEQSRSAVQLSPGSARCRWGLGTSLLASGRPAEALQEFRETLILDPKFRGAHLGLRNALLEMGHIDEARIAWATNLASGPPDHDDWSGYAELCLFLGYVDEYRSARRALLARFGESTDPQIAERTARACLLGPASGDELEKAVVLARRAYAVDRSKYEGIYPYFEFVQGLAEFRCGRFGPAISLMRGGASRALGPAPRLVLAMALHRHGQTAEARKTLAAAVQSYDWSASRARHQHDWIYHVLRREAEAIVGFSEDSSFQAEIPVHLRSGVASVISHDLSTMAARSRKDMRRRAIRFPTDNLRTHL
jgi:tetratricopeptide (TPR) repeat protein/tRNA A-37 threonylcarbamoyl transferase component Bud32